jgi:hypothetical protein
MTHRTSFYLAATLTFCATASFADVSAQEVWDNWQIFGKSMGQSYDARLVMEGDTLVAHDVTIDISGFSSDFMSLGGAIPKVILKELGNGTVEITIPESATYTSTVKGNPLLDLEPFNVSNTITMENTIVASGTPSEITYNILPGTVTYVTDKQTQDGIVLVPEQLITLLGVHGKTSAKIQEDRLFSDIDIQADAVTAVSNGTTELATLESSFKAAPLNVTASFANDATTSDDPMGFVTSLEGNFSYALGDTTFDITTGTPAQLMHISGEMQEAQIAASIADGSMSYTGTSTNTELVVDGSAIPFPQLDFGIGATEFGLTMPILANTDPKPVGMKLVVEKLRLPDIAWMMIDPQGQIPHDPAALKIDLSGNMLSTIDLMNPTAMMDMAGEKMPFQPIDLTLNELFLSVAGATLTGEGDAVFVDDISSTLSASPFKTAQATLSLTGGIALIDTLSQTGLVPPQMSTSVKMMLGIFARPGDAPDTFTSDIELKDSGALTINGQPMPF